MYEPIFKPFFFFKEGKFMQPQKKALKINARAAITCAKKKKKHRDRLGNSPAKFYSLSFRRGKKILLQIIG